MTSSSACNPSDVRSAHPCSENICAIIVTYFPDYKFTERLERIRRQVRHTIIVDNTPEEKHSVSSLQFSDSSTEVISNNDNLGVGEALNQGMTRALELGYPWTITFDQDTWIHDNLLSTLIGIYEQQPAPERVGIIGSNFVDENLHVSPFKSKEQQSSFAEVKTVITSGSLTSTASFLAVGPFRSDFFIDFIDHEYCLRLQKFGYKVLVSTVPTMVHALGDATAFQVGAGATKLSLVLSNRPPLRRYYMTRNSIQLAKMYFRCEPSAVLRMLASILGFALLKIPFEKAGRLKKCFAVFYGAFDGLRSKSGKADERWLD